jgi:hypothetical protein
MSFLRWSAAMIAAIVSGLAAAGSWHAGLLTDLVAGSRRPSVVVRVADGAVLIGMSAWAWLLPRERPWGVLAVLASAAVWFVVLGGLNVG